MKKPYQNDIDFLKEELEHHEYIARKSAQEHNDVYAKEFERMCAEIRTAIGAVEKRQSTAVAEWTTLSPSKRRAIFLPLFTAIENAVEATKEKGCPEFAVYLEASLSNFLIDLQNFTEWQITG